jgi:Asp/Glu/hydantoin racemase
MAHGGKTIYGARVGILILETRFPRIPGDSGNATTWPFPVLYKVIQGANYKTVVLDKAKDVFDDFVAGANELVEMGADGITTTCGFLSVIQDQLRDRCSVPVATSSLLQVPFVQCLLPPGKRVGIITESATNLTEEHIAAAGAPPDTPVVGIEHGQEFTGTFNRNEMEMDVAAAERDLLKGGEEMVSKHPDVGAVVLETANMLPFTRALSQHMGLPVYDLYSLVCWLHAGLEPRDFGHPGSAPRDFRER